jgi:osmotically-inducible protein OsmY
MKPSNTVRRSCTAIVSLVLALPVLNGCVPLAVTAVAGGALIASDRRTTGTQLDDEVIENKIAGAINERFKGEHHAVVTSYDGVVLLTGQVAAAADKAQIAEIARTTPKVRSVQDELVVGPLAGARIRTNDALITSKVKARFVEAQLFNANHVKVVTEQNVVYLMGIVRQSEADDAVRIARTTSGVQRVVKVFEYFQG